MKKCECGCGQEIVSKPSHKYDGIPRFINHHYVRTKEFADKHRKLRADPNSVFNSEEYRRSIAKGGKNRILTRELSAKLSACKTGKNNPNYGKIPTHLKDIHKNWKARDPEGYIAHQRKAGKKAFISCPRISSLELRFQKVLESMKVEFTAQFEYDLGFVDILIEPKIAFFIDGDFWHGNPERFKILSQKQIAQQIKDERQSSFLTSKGYSVERIWERELNSLTDEKLKELIQGFINLRKMEIKKNVSI